MSVTTECDGLTIFDSEDEESNRKVVERSGKGMLEVIVDRNAGGCAHGVQV